MKVLIVSDTHGQDENLEETVLREAPFDYLIHCGDVEGREIFIEALAAFALTIHSRIGDHQLPGRLGKHEIQIEFLDTALFPCSRCKFHMKALKHFSVPVI